MSQLHRRAGAAPSNFADAVPAGESELMQQLTKDPYNLEFLTLTTPLAERDLERALVAQLERFLLEVGSGFAFVGRQWRLELDDDEFFIDLLMFHIPTDRYVEPAELGDAPARHHCYEISTGANHLGAYLCITANTTFASPNGASSRSWNEESNECDDRKAPTPLPDVPPQRLPRRRYVRLTRPSPR